ncbi:MAG: NAD(P)H-hydrate epimerase [Acidimicrobiia bacterium]
MSHPHITGPVPTVTAEQMAEVDRLATGPYGIDLLQMMELAGRALARTVQSMPAPRRITVAAGGGGNGGGAMVAARRLAGLGFDVEVVLDRGPGRLAGAAAHQAAALEAIGIRPTRELPAEVGDAIIDGLIGYGLTDAPTGRASELISWIQAADVPVVSLDVPSGLDATTGDAWGAHVEADVTLTLALPKSGLIENDAVGQLLLADIAIPPVLWLSHFDIDTGDLFSDADVVDLGAAQLVPPR